MRLLILGATGAVGSEVLQQAVARSDITHIIAPSRTPLSAHPKLENPIIDFSRLDPTADFWRVDAVICTLGTTIKQAGSKAAFARIDRDLPIAIGKICLKAGATRYGLNSSLGAKLGRNFYLNTKAEAERGIAELGYRSFTIVRPSLINTRRKPARRGELVGLWLAAIFNPLIPQRYRPVKPQAIARVLLSATIANKSGIQFIESEALK